MRTLLQIVLICFVSAAFGQSISLPPRPVNAPGGSAIAAHITDLPFADREEYLLDQVLGGNVPDFYRKFCPVTVTNVFNGQTNTATFYTAPECLPVGTDDDYFIISVTPNTAQFIADQLGCVLPTPRMSDAIYAAAEVKMVPEPIPPTPAMTTVPVMIRHNTMVHEQRATFLPAHPMGALTAGYQKDVVISARLARVSHKVAIYGWHQTNGVPIQPLYTGHTSSWVDYSHGIRLVQSAMTVNGRPTTVPAVLADPALCGLLSREGVITNDAYPTNPIAGTPNIKLNLPWPREFVPASYSGEMIRQINWGDDGRMLIDAPATNLFALEKPVLLIFYLLPNGNTIEQTFGKKAAPGDDFHFDIQHIGAQTRWLRAAMTNRTIVTAYLEAPAQAWPQWRHEPNHDDAECVRLIDGLSGIFSAYKLEIALTSHSGGGSFMCGWLGAVKAIPDNVMHIAFLDSDYAYTRAAHAQKLVQWLSASRDHHLCILAYHDSIALLKGKTFVSEAGGTWGRSHAMLADLGEAFSFTTQTNGSIETHSANGGQIQFLLHENPDKLILHTVQVEKNGFIQAMLSGTALEGQGYSYFGPRAYTNWIQDAMIGELRP